MKQYTQREFIKILRSNGYSYARNNGSHAIYKKDGKHVSIPQKLECVIARRLIRENKLNTEL